MIQAVKKDGRKGKKAGNVERQYKNYNEPASREGDQKMKKKPVIIPALITALVFVCSSAAATVADFYDHMTRIREGTVSYTITTLETGAMAPVEGYEPEFADILLEATLKPANHEDVPDGEYVVLDLPEEHVRYDFFVGEEERNLFRQVNADGSEELYTATMPDEVLVTVSRLLILEANILAKAHGNEDGVYTQFLSGSEWLTESLNGVAWQDEDTVLSISMEDDQFHVVIRWRGNDREGLELEYICEYDEGKDQLKASYFHCSMLNIDEEGNMDKIEMYQGKCDTLFTVDEENRITITDADEDVLEDKILTQAAEPAE